jgi:glucokinase
VSTAAACDLSLVVVGGGVVGAADLLLPPVLAGLREFGRLDFLRSLQVREAALGPAAGLVGAAALVFAPDEYVTAGVLEAAHS